MMNKIFSFFRNSPGFVVGVVLGLAVITWASTLTLQDVPIAGTVSPRVYNSNNTLIEDAWNTGLDGDQLDSSVAGFGLDYNTTTVPNQIDVNPDNLTLWVAGDVVAIRNPIIDDIAIGLGANIIIYEDNKICFDTNCLNYIWRKSGDSGQSRYVNDKNIGLYLDGDGDQPNTQQFAVYEGSDQGNPLDYTLFTLRNTSAVMGDGTSITSSAANVGYFYFPTIVNPPTGTPTEFTWGAPAVINAADDEVCYYYHALGKTSGGTWKCNPLNWNFPLPKYFTYKTEYTIIESLLPCDGVFNTGTTPDIALLGHTANSEYSHTFNPVLDVGNYVEVTAVKIRNDATFGYLVNIDYRFKCLVGTSATLKVHLYEVESN